MNRDLDPKRTIVYLVLLLCFVAGSSISADAQPDRNVRSFSEIAKKVEPAVVSIEAKSKAEASVARSQTVPEDNSDMMEFLRRQMQPKAVRALGSGFIVDRTGFIITNAHVIEGATKVSVKVDSGEEFTAKVIGADNETDIAVLKIETSGDLPFVTFGDSDKATVGDWVLAIGSPFGLNKTVTAGIISQTRRETPQTTAFQRFIQTDAAINRGNSGGPLVNLEGDVIGVNSQIATSTGDYNGIAFALPAKEAEYVYRQLVSFGRVKRGYLGVLLDSVRPEFASVYGMKDARAAIITDVRDKQGPAALAGLKVGDIVTTFNSQRVESAQDLIAKVAATLPEQSVSITYLREVGADLDERTATVKLGERPSNRLPDDDSSDKRKLPIEPVKDTKPFGLTLSEVTPALAEKYRLGNETGIVIRDIDPSSFIADVKSSTGGIALGEGDLIQRFNRVKVVGLKAFADQSARLKVGDAVVLHVLTYNPALRNTQLKIVQFTVR